MNQNKEEVNQNNIIEQDYEVKKQSNKSLISFVITSTIILVISVGIIFLFLGLRDVFTSDLEKSILYKYLADAFTIPALIFIFLGLLFIVASKGVFNGLGYALQRVGRALIPFIIKKDITYAKYIENKTSKNNTILILSCIGIGTILLIVAIIFVIIFYNVE